jgi:hypothetical protein
MNLHSAVVCNFKFCFIFSFLEVLEFLIYLLVYDDVAMCH